MAQEGDDPVGSMGTDTPIAALSNRPKLLYNYFKQNFAQVTNPPIDPIREELVMSLISMIGPRPNLLGHEVGTHHRLEVTQPILTDAELAKIRNIERLVDGRFKTDTLDMTWPAAEGADGIAAGARPAVRRGDRGGRGRAQHPDPVRPRRIGRAGADPGAARDLGGASSPDPPGAAHPDRHRRRDRRGARGAPFLRAGRLRRRGDQPVSGLCDGGTDPHRKRPADVGGTGPEELPEGARQGHPEGDLQDGDLDLSVLLRRADLRRGRAAERVRREILHRHRDDDRGRRSPGDRRGGAGPPRARLWRRPALSRDARSRRRLRVPAARRGACLDAAYRRQIAARGARQFAGRLQGLRRRRSTTRASGC